VSLKLPPTQSLCEMKSRSRLNWLRSQRLAKLRGDLEYIEEVQKAEVKFRS